MFIKPLQLSVVSVFRSSSLSKSPVHFPSSNFTQSRPLDLHIFNFKEAELKIKPMEARQKYFKKCVPLHKAALTDDWKKAKKIVDEDATILRASITIEGQNVLHVAAGAGHFNFVKNLLKLLNEDDLLLQDQERNTPFISAAVSGSVAVAKIMIQKNPGLPEVRGYQGGSPLYFAALWGHEKMVSYLYPKSIKFLQEGERAVVFFTCIENDLHELALKMLHDFPELAVAREKNHDDTALHVLARKPSAFAIRSLPIWRSVFGSCCTKNTSTPGLELLKCLWEEISSKDGNTVTEIIRKPSPVLFTAALCENSEFLAELIGSYPALILETNESNQSWFPIAVGRHNLRIFQLVDKLGYKKFLFSFQDDKNNNMLHLAAKLAPAHQSDTTFLHMKRELSWFEEVKKVMPPRYLEMRNSEWKTPTDIFMEEHKDLLLASNEKSWLGTMFTNSLPIISIIVASAALVLHQIHSNEPKHRD